MTKKYLCQLIQLLNIKITELANTEAILRQELRRYLMDRKDMNDIEVGDEAMLFGGAWHVISKNRTACTITLKMEPP